MTDKKAHDVGYKNPPRHTQFKKGASGNPRGRPRKREGLNTVLLRVLNRKIRITDDDQRIPIQEALIRKLRELALKGDKQAFALKRRIRAEAGYDDPETFSFEEEQEEFERALEKIDELMRAREVADER